jgi:two-component system sensor histidine kinase CreC
MRATRFSLLAVTLIVAGGFLLLTDTLMRNTEHETFQATEEVMVDMAHVLAGIVEAGIKDHKIDPAVLRDGYPKALDQQFDALIFDLHKTKLSAHVYVTDAKGTVLYDSENDLHTGMDLSTYNDVRLTLQGKYGARSSRTVKNDSSTSTLIVGAPIYDGKDIIGVLSVRKPKLDQWFFVQQKRSKIQLSTILIGTGIALFIGLVIYWVLQPLRQLTEYVLAIKRGERPPAPELKANSDVNTLAAALEEMREELEGRDYAATFVQTLTHELKSPLAAIRATAELLAENNMDEAQRRKFTQSLRNECERTEHLIRQLLRLAEVERQKTLQTRREVDLRYVVQHAISELASMAEAKGVTFHTDLPDSACTIIGDESLLHRAMMNLIENAIDFSPTNTQVEVTLGSQDGRYRITICDHGPGIPDYALPRLFERFYSLKHKQTGRKGSGLGLCFAKETAELHGGCLTLVNRPEGGAQAVMEIPVSDLNERS